MKDGVLIALGGHEPAESIAKLGVTSSQMDAAASKVLGEGLSRLGLIESAEATYDAGSEGCHRRIARECA